MADIDTPAQVDPFKALVFLNLLGERHDIRPSEWETLLFNLAMKADQANLARLEVAFPLDLPWCAYLYKYLSGGSTTLQHAAELYFTDGRDDR